VKLSYLQRPPLRKEKTKKKERKKETGLFTLNMRKCFGLLGV